MQNPEPTHNEQSAHRTEIRQDLNDARSLLEQASSEEQGKKYRKAAEIILLKALRQEPENEEAKVLLQWSRSLQTGDPQSAPPGARVIPFPAAPASVAPTPEAPDTPPTTDTPPAKTRKKSKVKLPLALIVIAVLAGGFLRIYQRRSTTEALAAPVAKAEQPVNRPEYQPASAETQTPALPPPQPTPAPVTTVAPAAPPTAAETTQIAAAVVPAAAAARSNAPRPGSETGTLAVSSPIAADIYMGDKHLGSTPTTIKLPAGKQTLEYRHNNLRTVVTHDIKANETTSAPITFQVTLQINARPWAQVFLDGPARRSLGQTPLGAVVVPIGGTLIFENPNFASKSYRITDKDSAVQVNFP